MRRVVNGLFHYPAKFFQIVPVNIVKGGQVFAVNIKYGAHLAILIV